MFTLGSILGGFQEMVVHYQEFTQGWVLRIGRPMFMHNEPPLNESANGARAILIDAHQHPGYPRMRLEMRKRLTREVRLQPRAPFRSIDSGNEFT